MPDPISTGAYNDTSHGPSEMHPAESVPMLCVDVIDLGKRPTSYQGEDKGLTPKCALVFQSTEKRTDGSHFLMSREFTISTGRKANLRAVLESWRGSKYPEDYPDVPLHKMVGVWAMVSVIHEPARDGSRTYANLGAVTPIPKALKGSLPELPAYARPDYWAERRKKYEAETLEYLAKQGKQNAPGKAAPPSDRDFEDFPAAMDDDDDSLPF